METDSIQRTILVADLDYTRTWETAYYLTRGCLKSVQQDYKKNTKGETHEKNEKKCIEKKERESELDRKRVKLFHFLSFFFLFSIARIIIDENSIMSNIIEKVRKYFYELIVVNISFFFSLFKRYIGANISIESNLLIYL